MACWVGAAEKAIVFHGLPGKPHRVKGSNYQLSHKINSNVDGNTTFCHFKDEYGCTMDLKVNFCFC